MPARSAAFGFAPMPYIWRPYRVWLMRAQKNASTASRISTASGTSRPRMLIRVRPRKSKSSTRMFRPEPSSLARPRNATRVPSVAMIEFTRNFVMAIALTMTTSIAAPIAATTPTPRP